MDRKAHSKAQPREGRITRVDRRPMPHDAPLQAAGALTPDRSRSPLGWEGMLKLLSTPHLLVEKPFGRRWLVLRRTPVEWASIDEIARVFQQVGAVLRRADYEKI